MDSVTKMPLPAFSLLDKTEKAPVWEIRRWQYILAIPLMWGLAFWVMGKKTILTRWNRKSVINSSLFDGASPVCRQIKEKAATWEALDIIYNHVFGTNGWLTDFWLGMRSAQAVRNRLQLVKLLLMENIGQLSKEREIRLLSLASGSARAIIETVALFKAKGIKIKAVLVDINPTALDHSRKLAQELGVEEQIILIGKNIFRLQRSLKDYQPFHVVEMVGFLEYIPDKMVILLAESIRSMLRPEGVFVTSSIKDNAESCFLHWVVDWKMIYRDPRDLCSLLEKSGFRKEDIRILAESHSIFHVAVCRKAKNCDVPAEMV